MGFNVFVTNVFNSTFPQTCGCIFRYNYRVYVKYWKWSIKRLLLKICIEFTCMFKFCHIAHLFDSHYSL